MLKLDSWTKKTFNLDKNGFAMNWTWTFNELNYGHVVIYSNFFFENLLKSKTIFHELNVVDPIS